MKKYITVLLLTFLVLAAGFPLERAAVAAVTNTPHIEAVGEVWLLEEETGNRIFLLPDSYYARINNLDDNYYYVTFNGVNGKVSKNTVSAVGYHTTAKGTSALLGFSADYMRYAASMHLRKTPSASGEIVDTVPTNDSFTVLGVYPSQSEGVWYYVKYNQYYGYLHSACTETPDITFETFVPETPPTESVNVENPGVDEPSPEEGVLDNKTLRILIIVGLSVPAVLIIFLLFRPGKKKNYYDAQQ